LVYQQYPDEKYPQATRKGFSDLRQHFGQPYGLYGGDEALHSADPNQGSELCSAVEMMFSLETMLAITGDIHYADHLEKIAFNALPAQVSDDFLQRQYFQQANQVMITRQMRNFDVNHDGTDVCFGLLTGYPCCTSNMHQGWPKFTAHLWMRAPGDGLALMACAPSAARLTLRGVAVRATLQTDYPFRETLTLTVDPERPVRFPLWVRVPAWASAATLRITGATPRTLRPGAFHKLERQWNGPTEITLHFPMRPKTTRRYNQALAIERGPLVYSLKLEETWTRVNADKPHRELPHGDFEVRPASPWNYGLLVDENRPEASITFQERPIGDKPFSPDGAGIVAQVKGRRLPQWKLAHGWADEVQPTAQSSTEPLEQLTLIPYGCTNIRITEFPRLKQ